MRCYSGDSFKDFDKLKVIVEINLKFAKARAEIEVAMDSKESDYFNEEAECARVAVKEVLDMFDRLLPCWGSWNSYKNVFVKIIMLIIKWVLF